MCSLIMPDTSLRLSREPLGQVSQRVLGAAAAAIEKEYIQEVVNVAARTTLSSLVCIHRMELSCIQTHLIFSLKKR